MGRVVGDEAVWDSGGAPVLEGLDCVLDGCLAAVNDAIALVPLLVFRHPILGALPRHVRHADEFASR
jgi:hypothetical protein